MKTTPFPSWTIFSTNPDEPVHPRMNKPRSEHYRWLSAQFKKDGCDDYTRQKFLSQELTDEIESQRGALTSEQREFISAIAEWWTWDDDRRQFYLSNAFCSSCGGKTSFDTDAGYSVAGGADRPILLNGKCSKCGGPIARVCD